MKGLTWTSSARCPTLKPTISPSAASLLNLIITSPGTYFGLDFAISLRFRYIVWMFSGEESTSADGLESVIAKGMAAASNIPETSRTAKIRLFTSHSSTNAFPETANKQCFQHRHMPTRPQDETIFPTPKHSAEFFSSIIKEVYELKIHMRTCKQSL